MKVTLINGEVRLDLPQHVIDDSITIRDMINSGNSSQSITIETFLSIESLRLIEERCPPQDSLSLLELLNCPNLLRIVGSKILDSSQVLTDNTTRLFCSIPLLAYTGLLRGMITVDEMPTYDININISYEEFLQWHKNDIDRVIKLLNLRVPSSLLLTSITEELIDRLSEVECYALSSLVERFQYSVILDRIFRVESTGGCNRLSLESKRDELIDLVMNLQLNGDNYGLTFIEGALQYNYLYPLKYVESSSLISFSVKYMSITIDNNGLDQVLELVSNNQPIIDHIINLLAINGRIDLILPRLHLVNLDELRELWRDRILLSHLEDEDQYKQLIGVDLNLDIMTLSRLVRSDYANLAKTIVDSLTIEQLSMILILAINSEYDPIINSGVIVRISELISLESYEEFLTSKIAEYQDEELDMLELDCYNMELEPYHRMVITSLIASGIIGGVTEVELDQSRMNDNIVDDYHNVIRTLLS